MLRSDLAAALPHVLPPPELVTALRFVLAEAIPPPELLDLGAVLALTCQSKSSWYRAMAAGEAPASVRTPSGRRWKRKAILDWIARLRT